MQCCIWCHRCFRSRRILHKRKVCLCHKKGGAVHPRRTLDSYVLLLGCEGEYAIEQDGVEYMLTPGTYMLLLAGHTHGGTKPCPPKPSHFWCHFYMRSGTYITDAPSIKSAETKNSGYAPLDIPPNTCENEELILPQFGTIPSTEKYRLLFNSLIDSSPQRKQIPSRDLQQHYHRNFASAVRHISLVKCSIS